MAQLATSPIPATGEQVQGRPVDMGTLLKTTEKGRRLIGKSCVAEGQEITHYLETGSITHSGSMGS